MKLTSLESLKTSYAYMLLTCVAVLTFLPSISLCAKNREQSITDRECASIGNLIKSKGFTYPWWDQQQASSGTASDTCPGVTGSNKSNKCCKNLDSVTLKSQVKERFSQKWLGSKLSAAAEIFRDRKSRFDVTFKALLSRAHASFHAMFERTYGMLYIQHAHVFHALFTTLETYYDTGRDSLESKLNEFFAILTRKMFAVLNSQYDFEESYLSCATIVISEKQGNDLHRQIVSSLRRSFVATRALAQGLQEGDKVLTNLQKFQVGPDCLFPILQLIQCPICVEQRAYKPCVPQCLSIASKCLNPTFSMGKPWTEYTNALEGIIDRLVGPYNVEAVVEPIHIKISEAIMNFQESGTEINQAVFAKCGKLKLKASGYNKRDTSSTNNRRNSPKPSDGKDRKPQSDGVNGPNQDGDLQPSKSLEKLLRETKNKVKKSKTLWEVLPRQVCNSISKDYSSQLCWNGTAAIKPDKNKTSEENLVKSPSVKGTPNHLVAEQILILQVITDKLRASYNGQDVQWVQEVAEEFDIGSGMGSGSGDLPTDLDDSDDDDPSGQIKPQWKPPSKTNPRFPSGTPPPILNPLPGVFEEGDNERDNSVNFNVNTNSNKRPTGSVGSGNSNPSNPGISNGGIDFFVPPPPKINGKPVDSPTTTTTTTTTTRKPDVVSISNKPGTSGKGRGDADKTVAVFKLFTPIIVSMIGKLFSFS